MTVQVLRSYTRKRLAQMARRRGVPGWHDMRKEELIHTLTSDDRPRKAGEDAGQRTPRPNGVSPAAVPLNRLPITRTGSDRLIVCAAAPHWVRATWKLTGATLERLSASLGPLRHDAVPVLRLYDVSGEDSHVRTRVCDVPIAPEASEWFVEVPQPGNTYELQFGALDACDRFHRLMTARRVTTPLAGIRTSTEPIGRPGEESSRGPSHMTDPPEHRCIPTPHWARLRGHRSSVPSECEHVLTLQLDADLIVHGATDSQACVSVLGKPVAVRPNGLFEIQLPLGNGREVIPVVATTPDGRYRRTVVLGIERNTKRLEPQGPDDP